MTNNLDRYRVILYCYCEIGLDWAELDSTLELDMVECEQRTVSFYLRVSPERHIGIDATTKRIRPLLKECHRMARTTSEEHSINAG